MRNNPLIYLFRKTWQYAHDDKHKVVIFWFMFVIAELISLFVDPFVWAKIMNTLQAEGITEKSLPTLMILLVCTLLGSLLFWSFHGPARVMELNTAFRVRMNYREHLLKGIMTLPMEWHTQHHTGDTIDKIEKGTNALFGFSESSFEIIYAMVRLLVSYSVLIYFSHSAAYIVLGMIILNGWVVIRFDKVLIEKYHVLNKAENHISESVFDAISNISTVIILRVEKLVFKAIMRKTEEPFSLQRRTNILNEWKWFFTTVSCTIMSILVMVMYFWKHKGVEKTFLIGNVYLLVNYLRTMSDLFFHFTGLYGDIVQRKAKVMNSELLTDDFRSENFTNHVLPKDWQKIEVTNLNFSYQREKEEILNLENVAFSLFRGERIACVGESGSGKTTLLKLMRDLYHPTRIQLMVDERIIENGFNGIARAIALVPQDADIFATTIHKNITVNADYPMEFILRFTDMACFTKIANDLPNKFESSIQERGVNLSGGQKQRLALSRGLLACHDKDIVLLDEPTSSLDPANEMEIYQNIFGDFADKTIISSIHKLHLLPLFDRIFMFENGKIIATGTLQELLMNCPSFRTLWQKCTTRAIE